jgi:hypothetical protein
MPNDSEENRSSSRPDVHRQPQLVYHGDAARFLNSVFMVAVTDIEIAKKVAVWGSNLDRDGNRKPLEYVRLIDCSTEHLKNILKNCAHVRDADYETIILSILEDRKFS